MTRRAYGLSLVAVLLAVWASDAIGVMRGGTGSANGEIVTGSLDVYDSGGRCNYARTIYVPLIARATGASAPTWAYGGAGGGLWYYLFDTTGRTLGLNFRVSEDWDGASDIFVKVMVALDAAEDASDKAHLTLVCDYFGPEANEDMDVSKTQTRSPDFTITATNQGYSWPHTFVIDWDLLNNVVEVRDRFSCKLYADTIGGAGNVGGMRIISATARYRTCKPAEEIGYPLPTEPT